MPLFRRKKPESAPGISRKEALARRPVKSSSVVEHQTEGGLVLLEYPVTVTPWFGRIARRFGVWDGRPLKRKLELDEIGTRTWRWIDGKRDVDELIGLLAKNYSLHEREAEVSMTAFVRELGRRGIIALR